MDKIHHQSSNNKIAKFITKYLRRDGCFIIRLVAANATDIIAAEFICGLWEHFKDNENAIDNLFKEGDDLTANDLDIS